MKKRERYLTDRQRARRARNLVIIAALTPGDLTRSEVAALFGLTRARVAQIWDEYQAKLPTR